MRITLCGSARFEQRFKELNKKLSLEGHVVHSLAVYPSDMGGEKNWYTEEEKETLDLVHLMKIDNSDAIIVICPQGYIGDSTRKEIEHAKKRGKYVRYVYE